MSAMIRPLHGEHRARGVAALVELGGARPRPSLRFGIDGDDAVAERKLSRHRKIHQRTRGLDGDNLEMDGVAADHATERDGGVIGFSARVGGVERDHNRRRNFQRAGHGDDVMRDAGSLQFGERAFQQRVLDIIVEPCFDNQRARAGNIGLVLQRGTPCVCHQLFPLPGVGIQHPCDCQRL
jgi:hypothetical protein